MLVSLPALNEELTVAQVLAGIPRSIEGVAAIDILVVNDGSTDATAERAVEGGAKVLSHDRPLGVGLAFRTALRYALDHGFDLLVTIDSDGQFDPKDIPALAARVVAGEADFATASRFKDPALTPRMPWIKRWGNRQMSRLISRLTGRIFYDVSCGMRCYSRRAMLNLNLIGSFTYTQEVFLNLCFKGLGIVEVPVAVRGVREHGESRVANNLWRYATRTSAIIFRAYRDYNPMRFFGWLALLLLTPAVLLEAFFVGHYLVVGSFSPHKWAGFAGAALLLLSLLMFSLGMIGDLLNRHRIYLEEVLFEQRRRGLPERPRDP
jgi:glycosyltransferase involved in cell wall biosynthesis